MASHEKEGSARRLTKLQAQAFHKRWKAVNAAERAELASTPMALKFRQVAAHMASVQKLGWTA